MKILVVHLPSPSIPSHQHAAQFHQVHKSFSFIRHRATSFKTQSNNQPNLKSNNRRRLPQHRHRRYQVTISNKKIQVPCLSRSFGSVCGHDCCNCSGWFAVLLFSKPRSLPTRWSHPSTSTPTFHDTRTFLLFAATSKQKERCVPTRIAHQQQQQNHQVY